MRSRRSERALWTVGAAFVAAYASIPVLWMISLSLKRPEDLADGRFLPARVTFENYRAIFRDDQFTSALVNSLGIASISTALAIGVAIFAAYAIVRLDFPGRDAVFYGSLAVAMFPPISVIGPLFDMWRFLGLFDTWTGLVVPYIALTLPLAIWIVTAFFRDLPWELEQAARIDGATRLQALRKIIAPLAAPGVFAAAILVFLFAWNDFLFAISLTSTDQARTVPAALAFFAGESQFQRPTGSIAAATVVVTLPVVALVLAFQRRLVAGLTAGAVKG